MYTILDSYIGDKHDSSRKGSNSSEMFIAYLEAWPEDDDVTQHAAATLTEIVQNPWHICPEQLTQQQIVMKEHVAMITIGCKSNRPMYIWSSSPHMPNSKKFIVNYKMVHGIETSGLLPVMYQRLCAATGIE